MTATASVQNTGESGPHAMAMAAVADGIGVDGSDVAVGLGKVVSDGIGGGDGFVVQAPTSVTSPSASRFRECAIRSPIIASGSETS